MDDLARWPYGLGISSFSRLYGGSEAAWNPYSIFDQELAHMGCTNSDWAKFLSEQKSEGLGSRLFLRVFGIHGIP